MDIKQLESTTKFNVIEDTKCSDCENDLESVNVMLLYKGKVDSRWQKERVLHCSECDRYYINKDRFKDFKRKYSNYLEIIKKNKDIPIYSEMSVYVTTKRYRHPSCFKEAIGNPFISETVMLEDANGKHSTIVLNKCPKCNCYFVRKKQAKFIEKHIRKLNIKNVEKVKTPLYKLDYGRPVGRLQEVKKLNVVYENRCLGVHNCKEETFLVPFYISSKAMIKKALKGYYCKDCQMHLIDFNQFDEVAKGRTVGCELFVNYNKSKVNAISDEISITSNDDIPESADFFVRTNIIKCVQIFHSVINIIAEINVIDSMGNVSTKEIPAFYCKSCNLFFIYNSEYDRLKKLGVPLCPIYEYDKYINNKNQYNNLNLESTLHSFGYNVGATENLSDAQRRKILRFVIENGIMNKHEIIGLLNYFVNNRRGNLSMSNAIKKWESDVDYLKQDSFQVSQHVNVNSITIKNSIR